jgi:hypothetical protein
MQERTSPSGTKRAYDLNFQPLHYAPIFQMLFDDLVEIAFIHVGVPGAFGINHDDRTVVAAIHASGGVDTDVVLLVGNPEFLDLVLHVIARFLRAVIVAASAAVFALVGAEKNMFVVKTHGGYRVD